MVLLRHPPVSFLSSPRLHPTAHEKTKHFSLSSFHFSCRHNRLSQIFFLDFNAFLFNHVYRNPNRRLNCHLRWPDLFLLLFCLITNQLRSMIIKPVSSLLTPKPPFPSSFKCTVKNTLLWGNARLSIMPSLLIKEV